MFQNLGNTRMQCLNEKEESQLQNIEKGGRMSQLSKRVGIDQTPSGSLPS